MAAGTETPGSVPPKPPKGGNWLDWVSTSVAVVIIIICLIFYIADPSRTLLLAALFGSVLGWACGFISTPYDINDARQIGDITKVVSGAVSGYVVAKLDRVFDTIVPLPGKSGEATAKFSEALATHFGVCFVAFIAIFIFTYVTRAYVFDKKVYDKIISKLFR